MKDLKQLIRESINEYIRGIDEAGENAALEAKMKATTEAIELREKKMKMEGLDEAYHDMLDKGKMKELSSEIKALKKSLAKYEKQLSKLKSKGEKAEETPEEIIDEISLGENNDEDEERYDEEGNVDPNGMYDAGANYIGDEGKSMDKAQYDKDTMNESFLYMQKLAGVITEGQYQAKKKVLNEETRRYFVVVNNKGQSDELGNMHGIEASDKNDFIEKFESMFDDNISAPQQPYDFYEVSNEEVMNKIVQMSDKWEGEEDETKYLQNITDKAKSFDKISF